MKKEKINKYLENVLISRSNEKMKVTYINNGRYFNDLFGISFKVPKEWTMLDSEQFEIGMNNHILMGEYEYYKQDFISAIGCPSLRLTKYNPEFNKCYGLVSPTFNFDITSKYPDYLNYSLKDYADLVDNQAEFGYHMLKHFRVISRGDIYKRNGHKYIKYHLEYLFECKELDFGIMVEMSILNIEYGDFFLEFDLTDCKSQNQDETETFKMIEDSIELYY